MARIISDMPVVFHDLKKTGEVWELRLSGSPQAQGGNRWWQFNQSVQTSLQLQDEKGQALEHRGMRSRGDNNGIEYTLLFSASVNPSDGRGSTDPANYSGKCRPAARRLKCRSSSRICRCRIDQVVRFSTQRCVIIPLAQTGRFLLPSEFRSRIYVTNGHSFTPGQAGAQAWSLPTTLSPRRPDLRGALQIRGGAGGAAMKVIFHNQRCPRRLPRREGCR